MWGLTARETFGSPAKPPFLQTLARADLSMFDTPADAPDLLGYVELALRGGYPEPVLRLQGRARERWLQSYLDDTSLIAAALGVDERAAIRDGGILGRLIESFVLAQLRPELELVAFKPRLHHLREKNGRHEIDLIAELSAGDVVAVEIKSSAAPTRGDAKHLEWLRDSLARAHRDRVRVAARCCTA